MAATLKQLRKANGYSQADLAKAVGTSNVVICYLENGVHEPSARLRQKLESKLGEINWLESKIDGQLKL